MWRAATQRLSADWQDRYGITPWALETFVDEAHRGSCYRAANWIDVGRTQGRGRQDSKHACSVTPKRVLLYPLVTQAFPRLGADRAVKPPADWAEEEFGAIALDSRLVKRTQAIARDFFARPSANLPQACGTQAAVKAAYRFFDHPDTDMQTLLGGHYECSEQRAQAYPLVLAVCDTPPVWLDSRFGRWRAVFYLNGCAHYKRHVRNAFRGKPPWARALR